MDIIQFADRFQNFVKLVGRVVIDVLAYFVFLILWELIFALIYQALGVGKGKQLTIFDYLSNSWVMSTKGSDSLISENYWLIDDRSVYEAFVDRDQTAIYSYIMTNIVNTVKYINQVYLKIIMFAFLIAMIKGTFDTIKKLEVPNKYMSRCDMNQTSFNIYRWIPLATTFETDLVVVSAHFADSIEINVNKDEIWRQKVEKNMKTMAND